MKVSLRILPDSRARCLRGRIAEKSYKQELGSWRGESLQPGPAPRPECYTLRFGERFSMRKVIDVPIPIRIDKLTEILRIKGVPVYVHWTVLLITALILVNVIHHPISSLLGLTAYLGVLLIHESGHLIAAQRVHSEVTSIQLYPIFGITRFQSPWSKFDHCVIAWGGVLAQAVVALPVVVWVAFFGYTRFEAINAVIALLGFFNLGVAAFNLLPIAPLDGATAWAIIPESIKRLRKRRTG